MPTTTDPDDPGLTHGSDETPVGLSPVYLVLSESERARGFVRPFRRGYIHDTCGSLTTMGQAIAETYARNPGFYGSTFCVACQMHRPVGAGGEFTWDGTDEKVGT
jgi:hypothetical protein